MYTRRRRGYFILMGGCLFLFVSAWTFVRLWSVPAAVGMCVVAMVIPPIAAMVANSRSRDDRWWDDPEGRPPPQDPSDKPSHDPLAKRPHDPSAKPPHDPESEAWWDELDGRKHRR